MNNHSPREVSIGPTVRCFYEITYEVICRRSAEEVTE